LVVTLGLSLSSAGCKDKTPQASVTEEKLVVVHALWGALYGGASADVTKLIAAQVKGNALSVEATTKLLGDPADLKLKQLRVMYSKGGIVGRKIVGENEILSIPADEKPVARRLAVTKAVYGALDGGKTLDVTMQVDDMVKYNTLSVTPTNKLFGDPAGNKSKRLRVEYVIDGESKVKEVGEHEPLAIAVAGK
jgi:hypothetical protein